MGGRVCNKLDEIGLETAGLTNLSSSLCNFAIRTSAGSGIGAGSVAWHNSANSCSNFARLSAAEFGVVTETGAVGRH
jgi:hypothetical protein